MKRNLKFYAAAALILLFEFLLCRFAFFKIHGMKEWPAILLAAGLAVILISCLIRVRHIAVFTDLGYISGFFIAVLIHKKGIDPGSGAADNFWILWTAVFVCFIVASLSCELTLRIMKKKLLRKTE